MKKKLLLLIFISILLTSCLEVDSLIDLKEDGTGIWNLKYRISQEAVFVTPGLEFSGFNYFPVNEDELWKRTSEIPGLELLQVSSRETAGYIEYSAEMSFLHTNNIESFFNNFTDNSILEISSEEGGVFRLTIQKPYIPEIDQDTIKLLSALYSSKIIKINVRFSGIVTNSSLGLLSDDPQNVTMEIRTVDTITMLEPFIWTINYE